MPGGTKGSREGRAVEGERCVPVTDEEPSRRCDDATETRATSSSDHSKASRRARLHSSPTKQRTATSRWSSETTAFALVTSSRKCSSSIRPHRPWVSVFESKKTLSSRPVMRSAAASSAAFAVLIGGRCSVSLVKARVPRSGSFAGSPDSSSYSSTSLSSAKSLLALAKALTAAVIGVVSRKLVPVGAGAGAGADEGTPLIPRDAAGGLSSSTWPASAGLGSTPPPAIGSSALVAPIPRTASSSAGSPLASAE